MPARLEKNRTVIRIGDHPYRQNQKETVGLARCRGRLGAPRIYGYDGLIYAEADVDCDLEKLRPNCPPVDWTLNLTLARNEGWFIWSRWIEVAWKNHWSPPRYSTNWTDARVESPYCPSGNVETRGRVYYRAPFPVQTYGSPQPLSPTSTTISGCKKPPGDCTFSTYRALNGAVSAQCKTPAPRRCNRNESCTVLRQKKAHFQRCLAARQTRESTCFGGGDSGHRQKISEVKSAIRNCDRELTPCN